MRTRTLAFMFALMICVGSVFGQPGSQFIFHWSDYPIGGSPNWYPLTYDCNDPSSDTLRDGTEIRIFKAGDNYALPNPSIDQVMPIGIHGDLGEIWPTNEFAFNAAAIRLSGSNISEGSFFTTQSFLQMGSMPIVPFFMYLQVGCWNEDRTEWTCSYYSHPFVVSGGTFTEVVIGRPEFNPLSMPAWTCVGACDVPDPYVCGTDTVVIPWNRNIESACIQVCAEGTGFCDLYIGPFESMCQAAYPNAHPTIRMLPSCGAATECSLPESPSENIPAYFEPYEAWHTLSWANLNGEWYYHKRFTVIQSGFACIVERDPGSIFSEDCWLPVELMSFTASATVNGIDVEFRTGSETDNDYFELLRSEGDGEYELLTRLNSQGNGSSGHTYSYLDRSVVAGKTYSYKIADVDINGERTIHDNIATVTAISGTSIPEEFELTVYPNPFNPTTTISFTVVEASPIQLAIYDITGRQVAMLVNSTMEAGQHDFTFDATGLPSGIYLAKLETATNSSVQKMVLMK